MNNYVRTSTSPKSFETCFIIEQKKSTSQLMEKVLYDFTYF